MTNSENGEKEKGDVDGALTTLAKGAVDGASALFGRICLPAAEELGLLFKDKIHSYRSKNILAITKEAERILENYTGQSMHAHPRLVAEIMDHGSWAEDGAVQKKWAGLLISSCDDTGQDDSNLIFIDLLRQLSSPEVKILDYACQQANKLVLQTNILTCNHLTVTSDTITSVTGINDLHRVHRELAHLKSLGLLVDGEIQESYKDLREGEYGRPPGRSGVGRKPKILGYTDALITPSDLAFHLYVRSKGFNGSPIEYFYGPDYFKREKI